MDKFKVGDWVYSDKYSEWCKITSPKDNEGEYLVDSYASKNSFRPESMLTQDKEFYIWELPKEMIEDGVKVSKYDWICYFYWDKRDNKWKNHEDNIVGLDSDTSGPNFYSNKYKLYQEPVVENKIEHIVTKGGILFKINEIIEYINAKEKG